MFKKTMRRAVLYVGIFAFLAFSGLPVVWAAPSQVRAEKVLKRYARLFLAAKGTQAISTVQCRNGSGGSRVCIAVRVAGQSELSRFEDLYPNPLLLDGVSVYFTDRDPLPSRGGITINN